MVAISIIRLRGCVPGRIGFAPVNEYEPNREACPLPLVQISRYVNDVTYIVVMVKIVEKVPICTLDEASFVKFRVPADDDCTPAVITHRFHYTDFQKGFDAMQRGEAGKVVLTWAEG